MFGLSGKELIGVYLLLRRHEKDFDMVFSQLFLRIESCLYDHLSIEELEHIEEIYAQDIDVLTGRGFC